MPNDNFPNPFRVLGAAASRVATKSAMNPILWALAITFAGSSILAWKLTGSLLWAVIALPAFVLAYFFYVYRYWMTTDPVKLLSENFQMQRVLLDRLGDNITSARNVDLTLTDNPAQKQLTGEKEGRGE